MPDYDPLLSAIAEHGNLSRACRETGIKKSTFLDAVDADAELADQYTRMRARGFDAEAEQGFEEALTWEGDAALGRLALDARKWYLSKLYAKRYGDKITHAGDPEAPMQFAVVERKIVDPSDG